MTSSPSYILTEPRECRAILAGLSQSEREMLGAKRKPDPALAAKVRDEFRTIKARLERRA